MPGYALSLTESQTLTALRGFLVALLPSTVAIVRGQDNRVPEPQGTDFVVMTPITRSRLSTNVHSYADALVTGSITGTTLTVTFMSIGQVIVGATLFGSTVAANTTIVSQLSGTPGGAGTYQVSVSQTATSQAIAAGTQTILMPTRETVQLDVHGSGSADNSQLIAALFRDSWGVSQFQSSGFDVTPLYCEDPRQLPFLNDQQQIETRWIVDAVMQCNPMVTTAQQFAAQLKVGLIDVDVVYPH